MPRNHTLVFARDASATSHATFVDRAGDILMTDLDSREARQLELADIRGQLDIASIQRCRDETDPHMHDLTAKRRVQFDERALWDSPAELEGTEVRVARHVCCQRICLHFLSDKQLCAAKRASEIMATRTGKRVRFSDKLEYIELKKGGVCKPATCGAQCTIQTRCSVSEGQWAGVKSMYDTPPAYRYDADTQSDAESDDSVMIFC